MVNLLFLKGSSRSSLLGEATINLASFTNSRTSVPVSLPLDKCSHGTFLQVGFSFLISYPVYIEMLS